jgi:hypothetical protein
MIVEVERREPLSFERQSRNMPSRNAKSPTRLTTNAFLPASALARLVLEPEADEQVRAQADALPADEHHRQVRRAPAAA